MLKSVVIQYYLLVCNYITNLLLKFIRLFIVTLQRKSK